MKRDCGSFKKSCCAVKKTIVGACATLSLASVMSLPVSAATKINSNASTETVVGGILDVVFQLAKYLGYATAVIGIFMFIYSFKDDRAELQSAGIKTAIVGAGLLGLRALVKLTGLIS